MASYEDIRRIGEDADVYIELIREEGESEAALAELDDYVKRFVDRIDTLEIRSYLSQKYDRLPCYFSLNSGAGGTDAQDWTEILLRMYTR